MRKSGSVAKTRQRVSYAIAKDPVGAHAKLVAADNDDKKKKKKHEGNGAADVLSKALRTEFKPRYKAGAPKSRSVHKAMFLKAQRSIRKALNIENRVESGTFVALGRVLADVDKRVIDRMKEYLNPNIRFQPTVVAAEKGQHKLTEKIALMAVRSFFPSGPDPVWNQIHSHIDASLKRYHSALDDDDDDE